MVMARGWEGDFTRFYTSLLRTICNFWKRPGKTEGKRRRGKASWRLSVFVSYSCLDQGGGSEDEKKWTDFTYVLQETKRTS